MNRELLIWCLTHVGLDSKIIIESESIVKTDYNRFFEVLTTNDYKRDDKYSCLIIDYKIGNLLFICCNYMDFEKFVLIENNNDYDVEYLMKLTKKKAMKLSCNNKNFIILE